MTPETTVFLLVFAFLLSLIFIGVHIAFAFGVAAFLGNVLVFGGLEGAWQSGMNIALSGLGSVVYEYLRSEVFAAIPLFVLLGDFISKSGVAKDLYNVLNRLFRFLPGRLAIATVGGNVIFAAITGVSIAAAAAFSRIAYPEMRRHGYNRSFALGCVAGSASLGMIIPPSVLMIVWGIAADVSIAQLFLAGVIPGLLIGALFAAYVLAVALYWPRMAPRMSETTDRQRATSSEIASGTGTLLLITVVLGGIWSGFFTPTEAAGIGAALAVLIAVAKGMAGVEIARTIRDSSAAAAPILFLLLSANMFAKFMEVAGISGVIRSALAFLELGPAGTIGLIVAVWLLLGMFIDSISIVLLTVPLFAPLMAGQIDPVAFGILGILAIECGFLTPPFGLVVFTVKGTVDDPAVKLSEIFLGSTPYWMILLGVVAAIVVLPQIATWLPSLMAMRAT